MNNNLDIKSIREKAKNFSVLYVEDEPSIRENITKLFLKIFPRVDTAVDGEEGLEKYKKNSYDIVITDIQMPKMNGLELIRHIREINEKQEVIVISAYSDSEYMTQSIRLEVTGYIIKPIDLDQTFRVLERSIDKLKAFRENEMYKTELESMVEDRTMAVLQLKEESIKNYEHMIHSLVKMIEGRDTYTGGHSERVATYSRDIAKEMGMSKEECELIYEAGILHDVGKIITPDAILLKPGRLNDQEYSLIQDHVTAGYEILSEVPMYEEISKIVYAHHEHYDGSGYPSQTKGEEIPLLSRIMSVSDTFDAMTTSRIYKGRKTVSQAISELKELSGTWYDPIVIQSAVKVFEALDIDQYIDQKPNTLIDDERFAYFFRDALTGLYNSYYFDYILQGSKDEQKNFNINVIYLRNFTAYNKLHGWNGGDAFLKEFAEYLQSRFEGYKIFRIFGDDFVLMKGDNQEIDIDEINNQAFIKETGLFCNYKNLDTIKTNITSHKDLQEI